MKKMLGKAGRVILAGIFALPFFGYPKVQAQAQVSDLELIKLRESIRSWANRLVCDNMTPTKNFPQECYKPGGSNGVGDSVLFSSILCYSGEIWACRNVVESKDKDGSLWRSAQRRRDHYAPVFKPNGEVEQARFSYDHLLGVLLFLVTEYKRGHIDSARAYANHMISWIDNHKDLNQFVICPVILVEYPGYCSLELFYRTRLVRHVFNYIGVNPPERIASDLGFTDGLFKILTGDISNILKYKLGDGFPVADNIQPELTLHAPLVGLKAKCDKDPGFECHLAATASLILQETGAGGLYDKPGSNSSFLKNPFYLWVDRGRKSDEEIRRLTYDKCSRANIPGDQNTVGYDTPGERQWAWERVDNANDWEKSVGWDCVAMINLITDGQQTAASREGEKQPPSPVYYSDVRYVTIPPEEQQVEVCVDVDAKTGWKTIEGIQPGLSLTGVSSVSNSWSVNDTSYTRVGSEAHSDPNLDSDEQFKYDRKYPYGALLIVDPVQGGYSRIKGPMRFSNPITDRVTMRINDSDSTLGDNGGSLHVCFGNENVMKKVSIAPPEPDQVRLHWEYLGANGQPGSISFTAGTVGRSWVNDDSGYTYNFESLGGNSISRTGLYDASRDFSLLLYDDGRSYWKQGTNSTWNSGANGRWVKPIRFTNRWTNTCLASLGDSKAIDNPVVVSNCSLSTAPNNGMWYSILNEQAVTPDVMWYPASNGEIRNAWTNTCLASLGDSKAVNNPVVVSNCTGASNTLWYAAPNGELRNVGTNICLASLGDSKAPNNPVVVADCTGAANILWK